jgi:hypothetical protein
MKFSTNNRRDTSRRESHTQHGALRGEGDVVAIMQRLSASGSDSRTYCCPFEWQGIPTRMADGHRWRGSTVWKILQARA